MRASNWHVEMGLFHSGLPQSAIDVLNRVEVFSLRRCSPIGESSIWDIYTSMCSTFLGPLGSSVGFQWVWDWNMM